MKNEKGKNIFKKWSKNASREVQKSKLGPWASQMEICTFIDLAEFIRQMAENIHTFGGSPIFSYGHPAEFGVSLWCHIPNFRSVCECVLS